MHDFGPVELDLLRDLVACGYNRPGVLASLGEAGLCRLVVSAALCVREPELAAPLNSEEASLLEGVADTLDAAPGAGWWSASWRSRDQIWLSQAGDPPRPHREGIPARGKPPAVLWTSSALAGLPCAFWPVVESGVLHGSTRWWAWRLRFHDTAQVFEVDSVEDWGRLCEQYPTVDGEPDWERLREDFDGVHLTTRGLLRTQGRPVETTRGRTVLLGWDAESTAWFRWRVSSASVIGRFEAAVDPPVPSLGPPLVAQDPP